jgi:hypothetical protein
VGRNARLKQFRKLIPETDRKPKDISKMIECLFCHAWGYPRVHKYPQNEQEKKAILCPSCKKDLTPVIEARQKEEEEKIRLKQEIDGVEIDDNAPRDAPLQVVQEIGNENT